MTEETEYVVGGGSMTLEQDGTKVILTLVHDNKETASNTFEEIKECINNGVLNISLSIGEGGETMQ